MKKLFAVLGLLILFSCQKDEQVNPRIQENLDTSTLSPKTKKGYDENVVAPILWAFYRGLSSVHLRGAYTYDGTTWQGDHVLHSSMGSSTAPDAVWFNGKFHIFFKGTSSTGIYRSSSTNGFSWQPAIIMPSIYTNDSPSAIVFDNTMYVFFRDTTTGSISYIFSSDGTNWSAKQSAFYPSMAAVLCDGGITAAISPWNGLEVYFIAKEVLRRAEFACADASGTKRLCHLPIYSYPSHSPIKTTTAVNVVYEYVPTNDYKGSYYTIVYHKSLTGGKLHGSVVRQFRSSNIEDNFDDFYVFWAGQNTGTSAYTSNVPAVIEYSNKYIAVYKSLSSGAILYGSKPKIGSWLMNQGSFGQTTNGGVSLVIQNPQ